MSSQQLWSCGTSHSVLLKASSQIFPLAVPGNPCPVILGSFPLPDSDCLFLQLSSASPQTPPCPKAGTEHQAGLHGVRASKGFSQLPQPLQRVPSRLNAGKMKTRISLSELWHLCRWSRSFSRQQYRAMFPCHLGCFGCPV